MFYLEIQLSMERNPEGAPMKNLSGSVDMMTSENYIGFIMYPVPLWARAQPPLMKHQVQQDKRL